MKKKTTGNKTKETVSLINSMLDLLEQAGIPLNELTDRRKERMAEACLAVANVTQSFGEARSSESGLFLKTRDIIEYENRHFGENISPGSYDDVRRKDLAWLVEAGLVVNSAVTGGVATNNPTRGYALAPHFARLVRCYGKENWAEAIKDFTETNGNLRKELAHARDLEQIPVQLPSRTRLKLSAGTHNLLQKRVIEDFLPRFGMGAEVLYVGDTADKFLFQDKKKLHEVGFFTLRHEELPDIVAYSQEKNLLFLIEAVHSAGPMSEIRVRKLKRQLQGSKATVVFFTAFLHKEEFRKWVTQIAWETEVWIADSPDHLIHFNGYKFLEIHK